MIVVFVPAPLVFTVPGYLVRVQVPVAGKPLSITLPVAMVHDGWIILFTTGAEGVGGCCSMITSDERAEVHPSEFVTSKLYVPAFRSDTVMLMPVPLIIIPSG